MSYTLRPYQDEGVQASLDYLTDSKRKGRNGLVIAPTGSGKSLYIAETATRLPGQSIVFQPSKELLEQNEAKILHYGYKPAVFSASMGRKELGRITLATIGTAINYADTFKDVPFVLIDECHLVGPEASMYAEFLSMMSGARVLGFTATPFRLHSTMLGSSLRFLTRTRPRYLHDVVHVTQIKTMTDNGWWCPLRYEATTTVERERLTMNTKGSDYTDKSVQQLFGEIGFVGQLVDEVTRQLDAGRKHVLVYTRFVAEAERLATALGACAAVVTGETPTHKRARVVADFRSGKLRVVANVGVLALGFDFPELDCVVCARPSVSLAVWYQQIGRAVRPHPNKEFAVISDLVGLTKLFGKAEDFAMKPGGAKGDQWVMCSGDRPLTNIDFTARDGVVDTGAAMKAVNTRKFWARRKGWA